MPIDRNVTALNLDDYKYGFKDPDNYVFKSEKGLSRKVVARGVQEVRRDRPELGVVLITHYQRLLDHLEPDVVHILVDGRIVASGGMDLAHRLEAEGYESWRGSAQ